MQTFHDFVLFIRIQEPSELDIVASHSTGLVTRDFIATSLSLFQGVQKDDLFAGVSVGAPARLDPSRSPYGSQGGWRTFQPPRHLVPRAFRPRHPADARPGRE